MALVGASTKKRLAQFDRFYERIHDFAWVVDWRELGLPHCHVYVVGPLATTPVKVGIAVDGLARLAGLQTGNWHELYVLKAGWAESVADARQIERDAHKVLQARNLTGEWFSVTAEEAIEAVSTAARRRGLPFHTDIPTEHVDLVFDAVRARLTPEYELGSTFAQDVRVEKLKQFGISAAVNDAVRIGSKEVPGGLTRAYFEAPRSAKPARMTKSIEDFMREAEES